MVSRTLNPSESWGRTTESDETEEVGPKVRTV